jgi:hypothetical protein
VKIFRYFQDLQYAERLIERGEIMFSSLSHFRDLEGDSSRGDINEGNLRYRPAPALNLIMEGGRNVEMRGFEFRSRVNQDAIFICCFSQVETLQLRQAFDASCVVEILDHMKLISKIRQKVRLRSALDRNTVLSGPIDYREPVEAPIVDWAFPERIAFIKDPTFREQAEFRIAVGLKGAFAIENVDLTISPIHQPDDMRQQGSTRMLMKLGSLKSFAHLYSF